MKAESGAAAPTTLTEKRKLKRKKRKKKKTDVEKAIQPIAYLLMSTFPFF